MKITRFALTAVLWIGLLAATRADVVTHYVTTNGPGPCPYTSWATAASNIQDAVNVACSNSGDFVWVTNGTYYSRGQITLGGNAAMIVVTNGITLQSVNGPNVTIIDGNLPAYTNKVLVINHSNAVVSGFTITNGNGAASPTVNRGGGVYISGGTLTNCWITGNLIDRGTMGSYCGGAGVYCELPNCKVINCLIYGNTATNDNGAGGIYIVYNATALIKDCIISNNWCTNNVAVYLYSGGTINVLLTNCTIIGNQGGGLYIGAGSTVDKCWIIGNKIDGGSRRGGGVLNSGGIVRNSWILNNIAGSYAGGCMVWADGIISNCVVSSNYAGSNGGGGIYMDYNSFVYNCTITSNRSSGNGGGVYFYRGHDSRNGVLRNCLISSNSASSGGGVYFQVHYNTETGTIENCTIVRNYASSQGGGIYVQSGQGSETGTVINTIIYSNQCSTGPNWYTNSTRKSFIFCCTTPTNNLSGGNNITNDPQFVSYAALNFRLAQGSPCINAGTMRDWMSDTAVDLDGRYRVDRFSGRPDLGCYEHVPAGTMFRVR